MHRSLQRSQRVLGGLIVVAAGATLIGCGSDDKPDLTATTKEYSISTTAETVAAGTVSIAVKNVGKEEHEFVVFRTDLAEDKLPLNADGKRVDEEGTGITHLDPEAEGVKPGQTETIDIDLTAGRYVLVCNLPLHYKQGMHTVLTVS